MSEQKNPKTMMPPPPKKPKVPRSQAAMPKLCQRVVEDVVVNMRQAFLDDGVGEQVLQRMLHMWRSKIMNSESLDLSPAIPPPDDPMSSKDTDKEPAVETGPSTSGTLIRVKAFAKLGALGTSKDTEKEPALETGPSTSGTLIRVKAFAKLGTARQLDSARDTSKDTEKEPALETGPSTSGSLIRVKAFAKLGTARQLDGALDTSDEEGNSDDSDDKDDEDEDEAENEDEADDIKEEPLNSADDLSEDDDIEAMFETDNKVACQYDAVSRARNKWKFIFRDGIMNIHGKAFLFKRAEGDAVW